MQNAISKSSSKCTVDGCTKPHYGHGWCEMHYWRDRRWGNVHEKRPPGGYHIPKRDDLGRKHCNQCKQWLPIDQFHKNAARLDGLTYECKPCYHKKTRKYKYSLGISVDAWLIQKGGACAICGASLTYETLHIDHNKTCCSGKRSCGKCVRGPLCRGCNLGLGNFQDSPERLRNAAIYLEQFEKGT